MRRGLEARFADLLPGRLVLVFLCPGVTRFDEADLFAPPFFLEPLDRRDEGLSIWVFERELKSPPITVPCALGSVTPGKKVARVPFLPDEEFATFALPKPFFFRALL